MSPPATATRHWRKNVRGVQYLSLRGQSRRDEADKFYINLRTVLHVQDEL